MEACTTVDLRCLICRRVTLENLSIDSQVLSSNASLLNDFLNCFHVNYLDTDVNDLSTSCHLCLTCKQFIVEWSSIQTQMTQLTRRNAQLKATLSALLLSEHEIQERIPNQDSSDIVNNRIHNAQEIELPLLLHQTVDDIRNELRRKYSARVLLDKITHIRSKQVDLEGPNNMVSLSEKDSLSFSDSTQDTIHVMADKIQLPPVPKLEPLPTVNVTVDEQWDHWECEENIQLPFVPKIDPVSARYDNDDEPWDHSDVGADDCDMEYLLSENDDETSKTIHEMRPATEKDNSLIVGSHLQNANKTRKVKAGNRKTNGCPRKSKKQPVAIPVTQKKCKYNGFDVPLSELEVENLESLPATQRPVIRAASDLQPSPPADNLVEVHDGHLRVEDEVPRAIPVFPPPSPPIVNPPPLVTSTDGRPSSPLLARRRLRKRVAPASQPPPEVAHPRQESNDHEDPIAEEPEVASAVKELGPSVAQASSSGGQPDDDLARKRASMCHTCPDCGKSMFRSHRNAHDLRECQQTCEICGKKASRQAMPNHKCKEALKCRVTHKNPDVCTGYYKTAKALGAHIRQTSGVCECGEYVRGRDKAKHVCGSKKKKQ